MRTLQAIREAKAAKVAEARSLVAKATAENRSLTADESNGFDALKREITDLEGEEQRAAFLAEQERRSAGVVIAGNGSDNPEHRVSLLRVVRMLAEGRTLDGAEAEAATELQRRNGAPKHGGILVPLSALESRASTSATAGSLIPTEHRPDLMIAPLRASLAVKSLGVRTLTGLSGNVSIPRHGGLSVGWVPEGGSLPESDLNADAITLTPRHVGGITELSRNLLIQGSPDVQKLVAADLSAAIGLAVDTAIIGGTGLAGQPQGIIGRAGVLTAVMPDTWGEVLAVEQQLRAGNVDPSGWYTSPAVMTTLRGTLKDATAGSDYIATLSTIGDLPAAASNAAPAGKAVLGDWSQVIVGQWGDAVEILVNPYSDAAYRRGGVLVRAFLSVDVGIRHNEAFVVASAP